MSAANARGFRVVGVGPRGRVVHFTANPLRRPPLPDDTATVLVSMGVYVFDRHFLVDCLSVDAEDRWSSHDFNRDVLPLLVRAGSVAAHVFRDPRPGRSVYWRELGTLDRYWRANLELLDEPPVIDFADRGWPLRTQAPQSPPPRVVGRGTVARSIVSAGCVIGGCVEGWCCRRVRVRGARQDSAAARRASGFGSRSARPSSVGCGSRPFSIGADQPGW
jgi:glucose-1-phosphate adenylyltransferase